MDILDHALADAAENLDSVALDELLSRFAPWYTDDPEEWQRRVERLQRAHGAPTQASSTASSSPA